MGRTDGQTDGRTDGVTALLDLLSPSATQVKIPMGWGVIKFQFLVSSPDKCYIAYLVKIGPVVLEKKMFTHHTPHMTDDEQRQPIELGHLSQNNTYIYFNS